MLCDFEKVHLVQLQKRYDFQSLRPPAQVYHTEIAEQDYFSDLDTKQPRRRIYYNVSYNSNELRIISEVKASLQQHHIHQSISDQLILKHAYMAKFNHEKIIERLKDVVNYHNNPIITCFSDETVKRLNSGVVYTYGYDRGYRPILIIRIDRINHNQSYEYVLNTYYYVMLMIYHYRLVPYHAEKITFIFDFAGIPLTSIPIFELWEQLKRLGVYYCGITERVLLYNADSLGWVWRVITSFLNQNQKRKLIIVEKGNLDRVLEFVQEDQLEKKYGGKRDNLTEYWPPKSTKQAPCNKLMTNSSVDYFSVDNDIEYFEICQDTPLPQGCCTSCNCDIY